MWTSREHIDTYKRVRKYALGVERALDKVPQWVWNVPNWHIEEDLTAMVGDVPMHGRPDLWRKVNEDDLYEIIELWDIKTTEHDPMDYVLWNPQLRTYAAALSQAHNMTVVYRVLTLPTDQKKPHRTSPPLVFTEVAHQRLIGPGNEGSGRDCRGNDFSPRGAALQLLRFQGHLLEPDHGV